MDRSVGYSNVHKRQLFRHKTWTFKSWHMINVASKTETRYSERIGSMERRRKKERRKTRDKRKGKGIKREKRNMK